MAIYFQTKIGIMVREKDTPEGLVYITKDGEVLTKHYNEKEELVGLLDSKGNLIDDFVRDGKLESLALHKLSFDVYPNPHKKQTGPSVSKVEDQIDPGIRSRLLEKTKKVKRDYTSQS